MKKYEILVWENKMWNEIPQQDNPAFSKSIYFEEDQPDWFALVICKVLPQHAAVVGKDGYVVLDVSVNVPDVLHLGLFWDLKNAKIFADKYVESKTVSPIES